MLTAAAQSIGVAALLTACRDDVAPESNSTEPNLPRGFATTTATLRTSDGAETALCVWMADTAELRSQGFRSVDELGADGMVFRWDESTSTSFTMSTVRFPLTLATFDADGRLLEVIDMEPCPSGADCRSYRPSQPLTTALEVEPGRWAEWLGPGATLIVERDRAGVSPSGCQA